jgi:peptidoglycan hydrolase FlgJ
METNSVQKIDPQTATRAKDINLQRQKLRQAAAGFESLFLTYMLKSMRSAVPESGLLGSGQEHKLMQSMLDEKIAIQIADGGGAGLGDTLYEQLAANQGLADHKKSQVTPNTKPNKKNSID